jgi:hypothetical protein
MVLVPHKSNKQKPLFLELKLTCSLLTSLFAEGAFFLQASAKPSPQPSVFV